jgi:hypothetical protein
MTPAPPTGYVIEASPQSVCYGENINLRIKLGEDQNRLVYWERKGTNTGKVPPLANEYILVKELNIHKDQTLQVTFQVSKTMEDIRTKRTMTVVPGEYMIFLGTPGGDINGAGTIQVKDCF